MAVAEQVRELLQFELRSFPITLQVNQAKEQLTIVLNRNPDADVDYSIVTETILQKLNSFEMNEIEKYKIIGRVEKQTKPEWQHIFDNPNVKKGGFLGLFGSKAKK